MDIEERLVKAKQISSVLKEFTSEAVQLRILEFLLTDHHKQGVDISDGPYAPKKDTKRARKSTKSGKKTVEINEPKSSEAKKKAGRPGPGEMINSLIDEGYFSQKRGMGEIIDHCQKKLAYTYKTSDLSPTLTRALRSGKLVREQNSEGQYEYFKK